MEMEMNKQLEEVKNISSHSELMEYVAKHTDFNNKDIEWAFMLKIYEGMESYAEHVRKSMEEQEMINEVSQ